MYKPSFPQVRDEEKAAVTMPQPFSIAAIPRTACHPDHTYIITGGLGGFGMELGQWLIDRGCRKLVLTSRSGVRNGYQARKIRLWKEKGVFVSISKRNIKDAGESRLLIEESSRAGPVAGLFHLAMVSEYKLVGKTISRNFSGIYLGSIAHSIHL